MGQYLIFPETLRFPRSNLELYLIAMIMFHNTVISNIYSMSVIFKIAIKGTKTYCFLENAFCCVSATEFRLCFLPKLTESATYCCNSHLFSYALSFPSPFFFSWKTQIRLLCDDRDLPLFLISQYCRKHS